jgi:iron-sulfur cluster assembly protein
MLNLTPAAARAIHSAAERSGLGDEWALRLAADVDGDGALRFGMGFDDEREADLAFTDHGVPLLVGAASREWLTGVTLDFVAGPDGAEQFIFLPPEDNAPAPSGSAGCGSGGCSSCASTRSGGCG